MKHKHLQHWRPRGARTAVPATRTHLRHAPETSVHVRQAAALLADKLGCDESEAISQMQARSSAVGEALDYIALDVLDGIARLD